MQEREAAARMAGINWFRILLFYTTVLLATAGARKLPNLLALLLGKLTDIRLSFNYNHGLAVLVVTMLFYRSANFRKQITLLGTNKRRALLFPLILIVSYVSYGIGNSQGIDRHLWALITCCFALVYNLMEEYAWRGYLVESLGRLNLLLKGLISGVFWCCWHLLIFSSFDMYGGFLPFLLFCIVFGLMLTFAVQRSRSILVAAAIHAFIIQLNVIALIDIVLFGALLLTWKPDRAAEQSAA